MPEHRRQPTVVIGQWSHQVKLEVQMQICEAYGANRYPFPEEPARQRQMNAEVTARLRELHTTIEAGECVPGYWLPC